MGDNVKLINRYRETGGSWNVAPEDRRQIAYINAELTAYQQIEPASDWHLETRGSVADWHRVHGGLLQ